MATESTYDHVPDFGLLYDSVPIYQTRPDVAFYLGEARRRGAGDPRAARLALDAGALRGEARRGAGGGARPRLPAPGRRAGLRPGGEVRPGDRALPHRAAPADHRRPARVPRMRGAAPGAGRAAGLRRVQ